MRVIIIGQSIERSRGGIATVIKGMIDSNPQQHGYYYEQYVTHVEGSTAEKVKVFTKAFFKMLFSVDVSLVHIHAACDGSFLRKGIVALLCRLKGVPAVMHIHGADFDSFYAKSQSIVKLLIRTTLRQCARVIVLSNYWKKYFEDEMKLENIEVIFNAVNTEIFAACNTTPHNIKSFLFLGRLGERKGVYDLLKAIDQLVNKQGLQDLMFYLAGDGEVAEVSKIVEGLALNNNVKVLGWVGNNDKPGLLSKVDTVLLPSYNEGLPVALLEAMAAGKVILSTRVGGIPDLITEHVNGYLIEPGDVESLAIGIKYISENPGEMEIISRNNILKIKEEFNSVEINQQVFRLYDQILNKRAFAI
jgi:glycosyltransferase involved in cell wall biosynthesis